MPSTAAVRASDIGPRAPHGFARNDMNAAGREFLAVALGPVIGCEIDGDAAAREHLRERFSRKQVAAGSARSQQNERRATVLAHLMALPSIANSPWLARSSARGRSRVTASSIPMA